MSADYFSYDKDSGEIHYIRSPHKKRKLLSEPRLAGKVNTKGRRVIGFNGKYVFAHRLAWFLYYGEIPSMHIDHIDGNPLNNSINNLRLCTRSENNRNMAVHRSGKYPLVSRAKSKKESYEASFTLNGKRVSLGCYECAHMAAMVVCMFDNGQTIRGRNNKIDINNIPKLLGVKNEN